MSGFISIEMYLALADELKAYKDKNQFLQTEIKRLRTECLRVKVDLENAEEQMELVFAHYNLYAD